MKKKGTMLDKDPDINWLNSSIQFPRLIAEAEAAGAFTPAIMLNMAIEMDLEIMQVVSLIDRAQIEWDRIKAKP